MKKPQGPGQRSRYGGCVDDARVCVVAKVERGEIEEVENQDEFSPVEVRADKDHGKSEVEEVVHDEVASHISSGVGVGGIG